MEAGFGWAPRSMPLAESLTESLSALLDDQLQQWTMSHAEMDNTLQQQEALVASLVDDVGSALGEEKQKRQSIVQTLDSAKQYVEARRMGPTEFDDFFERLESIGSIVDNDFDADDADDPSESLLHHVDSASAKSAAMQADLIKRCRARFRKMKLSPEELFNMIDEDRSGYVDEKEFIDVVSQLDTSHVDALFMEHDKDGSGYLCDTEVRQLAKKLGKVLTAAELGEAMSEMDPSGDGRVDLGEFIVWWRSQTESRGGGVLGDALSSQATALEQDYRWFFATIDAGVDDADGKLSLQELSSFVWAWEPATEYKIGEIVIEWAQGRADPVVHVAQNSGKSGTDEPDWKRGAGGAEEEQVQTIKDGELTWAKQVEQATRLGELCREPT